MMRVRRPRLLAAALTAAALALAGAALAAAPSFPSLTGRVVDGANILPAQTEAGLTDKLAALETRTGRQLVVATLPNLQGYEIEEYGYRLGRAWGIGQAGKNDGALLIVAPNERKVRIEVGYGLEGVLTDAMSSLILQTHVLPRFREGDMAGGVVAGTDAVIEQLTLDAPAAQARVATAENRGHGEAGGFSPWTGFIVMLVIFWMLRAMMRGGRRRRRGLWIPPVIIGGGGWGGRGGGGGWSGGGGFSGGGGSFGGGGSSGGW